MTRTALVVLGGWLAAACVGVAPAQAVVLQVRGTSDITDSGLEAQVIEPGFAAFSPGDTIGYTAQGSGAALTAAQNPANNTDVVLVHAPALEANFVAAGSSAEPLGRALFYNDYVIVGPKDDPAGVLASFGHDAVGAYQAIYDAGTAGTVQFYSRNDNSGTNTAEQAIWAQTTGRTLFQTAAATATAPARAVPSTDASANTAPAWYVKRNQNSQGQNLIDTNACNAPATSGHCYTLVDRGTYFFQLQQGNTSNLQIVTQDNSPTAVGGASELTNPFHGYVVSTSKNKAAAARLLDYLTSKAFQDGLLNYPGNGRTSVFPDAVPQVGSSSIPASAPAGSAITITARLQYAPPVPQPIGGLPVQLQQSSSGTGGFANVGEPVRTGADGTVAFTPTVGSQTTYYRLSTPAHLDAASASLFTAGTQVLGTQDGRVDVATAPGPDPAPGQTVTVTTPGTTPPPAASTLVGVSSLSGSPSGRIALKLAVPQAGRVTVSATARSGGRRLTFAATRSATAAAARTVSLALSPSRAGKRAIRGTRRAAVTLTIRFTPGTGSPRTTTSRVTVG